MQSVVCLLYNLLANLKRKGEEMESLTIKEQIKLMAARQGITLGEVADKTNQTRQNISLAFRRDDYSTKWLERVADAMECDLVIEFKPRGKKSAK